MPLSEMNRAIWLWLFNQGGFWTALELAQRTGYDSQAIFRGVHAMERRGLLASMPQGRRKGYGVTGTCLVPKGMSVAEVQA